MPVHVFIVVRRDIATGKILFNPFKELGIRGHQIFALSVDGAFFHHPDLPIALDDLRFDFADFLVYQVGPVFRAVHNCFARFVHAGRAQRIGCARPAERGLGLLPGFQHRLFRPLGNERRIRPVLIEELNRVEGYPRCPA